MENKRMLIVSSHALDFVWRAGGTIASYKRNKWEIKVICLTYGERGESGDIWANNPGINETQVKEIRKKTLSLARRTNSLPENHLFWDFNGTKDWYRI